MNDSITIYLSATTANNMMTHMLLNIYDV